MKRNRIYSVKDVEMLLAARTIAKNFRAHLPDLAGLRTNWDESYAKSLEERIDATIEEYLGRDKQKELKEATLIVTRSQASAILELNLLKTQIKIDLPREAARILAKLGYTKYGEAIKNRDQESLIEMLFVFKKEMNDKLKTKICSKGINPEIIDRIIEHANQLKDLNTIQETMKEITKQLTGTAIDSLNTIYSEVSGICKIARTFYQPEPLIQQQFVFSGIVDNMNNK